MEPYANSLDHILAELERLDLFIRLQVWRARQLPAVENNLQSFYVPEEEVDQILDSVIGRPLWTAVPLPEELVGQIQTTLDSMALLNEQRQMATSEAGLRLRLNELADLFDLTPFDIDVLLLCLAPELELRYTRLYAYLQDNITSRYPTIDLALNLFCYRMEDRVKARLHFSPESPLCQHNLLNLLPQPDNLQTPLLSQSLKLDERVLNFLLEADVIDSALEPHAELIQPLMTLEELFLAPLIKERLQELTRQHDTFLYYFHGPYGVGRQSSAEALCQAQGLRLLVVDGAHLALLKSEAFDRLVQLADREARLQGAALYWQDFDALLADDKSLQRDRMFAMLKNRPGLTFLTGQLLWEPVDKLTTVPFVRLELSRPDGTQRHQLWAKMLNGRASEIDLAAVANKFRFTPGQIRDAVATASNMARWRNPETAEIKSEDIYAASRLHSNQKLAALAQKITPHYAWEDIILPPNYLNQLQELCQRLHYRFQVYQEWGFDAKMALGKGITALFTGQPGTGKTMAADIIAGQLGLDLYKIDLSTVVSKYIGETEKNLSKIFAEAETSHAILFFDEADSLFGKRTEVKDAHDRYANLETSYLLQKMEEYEGMVILATNLRQNIDEAFVRRMHYIIEFPFPTAVDRLCIWQQIWPAATPLDPELDLDFMAGQIEVAGGYIRNIALAAAFLAAAEGSAITMTHLLQATEREYRKMGRLMAADAFGPYHHLLR